MKAKAMFLGHPVHPMLIVFPLGLFPVAARLDIAYRRSTNAQRAAGSQWRVTAGVVGSLIAAVLALIDSLAPEAGTRAKAIGLFHGLTNFTVVVLFIISWFLRQPNPAVIELAPIILCFIGVALALLGGWLGGELVYRMNVGVDAGAHIDSPSSLSSRPAPDTARPPRPM